MLENALMAFKMFGSNDLLESTVLIKQFAQRFVGSPGEKCCVSNKINAFEIYCIWLNLFRRPKT